VETSSGIIKGSDVQPLHSEVLLRSPISLRGSEKGGTEETTMDTHYESCPFRGVMLIINLRQPKSLT
jgi:hypothetical protein